ncbi:MAG TPA: nucleotidyl transferase AbiEii/AbiGii toxin family protein [Candidatus Binatia bacterium]|nr:nucleotidyl transferase AbiEii/AbiGii toxin family protein [Candidatus Binatia bacterium]
MITPDNPYYPQAQLLVRVLPFIAAERVFALKGGTAINLFVRDMPRLSVDIDLAFIPINDRATALRDIDAALRRIKLQLESVSPAYRVHPAKREHGRLYGILVSDGDAEIKVEVSPVLRGSVFPESDRRIVASAEAVFGFAEIQMLSFEDLYAGKIVAALDRQHPRDLFDIKLLLETHGISENLFRAFLVYLISHHGSMARVVAPQPKPLERLFESQFKYMSAQPVTLAELEKARADLTDALRKKIGDREKTFLLSFKRGDPKWDLLNIEHAAGLPAVRWKLQNLDQMGESKRNNAIQDLVRALETI